MHNTGTSILNAPLGTHEFMEDMIVTKVKELEPLFKMGASLENVLREF